MARAGKVGAEVAWRLDIFRATGLDGGLRRFRPRQQPSEIEAQWNTFHHFIWQDAAETLGAELEILPSGFIALRCNGQRTIVWQNHVMLDDPVTIRLALDKAIGYRFLTRAGLPVAKNIEFSTDHMQPALHFLAESEGPCVIKPASGTGGGHGVTCGVTCVDDLLRACTSAMRSGRRLLIEHQAEGDEYRLLFLDGTLLDAVRRRPPVLVGDGRSTVGELIEAENRHRWASRGKAGMRLIEVDLDCILTLRRAGMSLKSVPPAGSPLKIKSTTNVNGPGDNETVQDIGLELVVEARRAAALLGVRLAGVDVIAPDRRLPLRESGGVIVEVNGTPGIHYHYLVADRDHATRVAIPILSKLLGLA